jgi:hypothetical protein
MYETALLEESMATTLPEVHTSSTIPTVSADYIERLEDLARKHGWTVDEAMSRALSLTEIVLDAKDEDPASKFYLYRDGKRYAVQIEE